MPYTIQGVELLTKQDYYRPTLLSLIIVVAFIAICVSCVHHFLDNELFTSITLFISLLISAIFLFCCILPDSSLTHNKHLSIHYTTEYQVTISDEVPLQTLLSHYEIVSQDEKIYTLKEKN